MYSGEKIQWYECFQVKIMTKIHTTEENHTVLLLIEILAQILQAKCVHSFTYLSKLANGVMQACNMCYS